jgi:hypothetical protein
MQRSSALEVVFRCRLVISHLLSAVDESLLDWGNPLLLFDTLLYPGNLVVRLNIKLDLLSGQGADSARGSV